MPNSNNYARIDRVTAVKVEQGLQISFAEGLDPALQFFERTGVARTVALRVLCSPQYFRYRDRRKLLRARS